MCIRRSLMFDWSLVISAFQACSLLELLLTCEHCSSSRGSLGESSLSTAKDMASFLCCWKKRFCTKLKHFRIGMGFLLDKVQLSLDCCHLQTALAA